MAYVQVPYRSVSLVAGQRLSNTTLGHVALGESWSVAVWCKPIGTYATNRYLLSFESVSPFNLNRVDIFFSIGGGFNNMNVILYTPAGVSFKNYVWLGWWAQNTWVHTVVTWDGTNLRGYKNGVEDTVNLIKFTDNAGTPIEHDRSTGVGCLPIVGGVNNDFQGIYHSAAI
ncbi:MAG: LamG domain-containing protein, partial [Nitrospira sp.]|nr:LamG domain-containing protein [Nitrospira sp.]